MGDKKTAGSYNCLTSLITLVCPMTISCRKFSSLILQTTNMKAGLQKFIAINRYFKKKFLYHVLKEDTMFFQLLILGVTISFSEVLRYLRIVNLKLYLFR